MLDRFLKLKRAIAKSFLDFDALECKLAEGDYEVISEVVQTLEPFKAGAEMICRREATTLITADGTFQFMIQELEKQQSGIAKDLKDALVKRVTECTKRFRAHQNHNGICHRKEFSFFEVSGERSQTLEKLYKALLTVRPSSVESERAFSTTGIILTTFRCSIKDETVDTLVFLRNHFLSQRK
ncbi:Uncharacterised protein r2_g2889 [Pycnogonum litorale]